MTIQANQDKANERKKTDIQVCEQFLDFEFYSTKLKSRINHYLEPITCLAEMLWS